MKEPTSREALKELKAEDIYLSFFYAYFYGLRAMARAPHALVYTKTIQSFEDFVAQTSRSKSEIRRIYAAYPPFQVLEKVLEREIYSRRYRSIAQTAAEQATSDVDEWTCLYSTK